MKVNIPFIMKMWERPATGPAAQTAAQATVDTTARGRARERARERPRGRARPATGAAVLLFILLIAGGAFAQNAEDVRVTNHLFAERVIQTADGGFVVQEVIVGFERGRHSFETLTQIVLPTGEHSIEMAITDPEGKQLERIRFGVLEAPRDGWTMSLRGQWRNIQFETSGMHVLLVYRNGRTVARFFLTVE